MHYIVHWVDAPPSYQEVWNGGGWSKADTVQIDRFHSRSSEHRPETRAKLLYDDRNLYLRFRVKDRFVKAVHREHQSPVCEDSCVEFFLMPALFRQAHTSRSCCSVYQGYFNVELNCIGTMLLSYVEDWRRTADGFARYSVLEEELLRTVGIFPSLSAPLETEIEQPLEWTIGCTIPFALLEYYLGPLSFSLGNPWRGNFYKCADRSSHPHWASWSSIGEALNFHNPDSFGTLEFGE